MELPNEDIKFITDETLDFGLSSPSDGPEEEGSLICALEPNERCVAQAIDMNVLLGESEGRTREQASPWRPLSPEKLEEVMKEANMLATQLERCKLQEKENTTSELKFEKVPEVAPLSAVRYLHAERASSRSPRRETFNVKNSPLKALLPTVGPESSSTLDSPKTLSPKHGSPAPAKRGSPASCVMDSPNPKRTPNKSNTCSADSQLSKKSRPSNSPKTMTTTKSPSSQAKTMGGDASQSQSSFKPHSSSCQIRTRNIATSVFASQLPVANSIPKATSRITTLGRPAVPGRPSQLKPLSLGMPGAKGSTLPIPARKKGLFFNL
ncbi:proline/serine-rich coiled-coil protein 1 [Tiliqua scincoides]|uniref:proline/serine-rich coiled-coil protein 1 n=1 Tax=Tiliqua scincoides TaxID=71010 RepID=UPI0034625E81